jgi:hypothetical protein
MAKERTGVREMTHPPATPQTGTAQTPAEDETYDSGVAKPVAAGDATNPTVTV